MGCMVTSNDREIVLMLAGNTQVKIPRTEIQSQQMLEESLMPPNLLEKAQKKDVDDLFAYLGIREKLPSWFEVKANQLRLFAINTVPGLRLRYKVFILITFTAIAGFYFIRWKRLPKNLAQTREAALK